MRPAQRTSSTITTPLTMAGVVALVLAAAGCGDDSTGGNSSTVNHGPVVPTSAHAGPGPIDQHRALVAGVVKDADGKPVPAVGISVTSLDKPAKPIPEMAVLTDAQGHYTWSLEPGRYSIDVSGVKAIEPADVLLPADGRLTVNFTQDAPRKGKK